MKKLTSLMALLMALALVATACGGEAIVEGEVAAGDPASEAAGEEASSDPALEDDDPAIVEDEIDEDTAADTIDDVAASDAADAASDAADVAEDAADAASDAAEEAAERAEEVDDEVERAEAAIAEAEARAQEAREEAEAAAEEALADEDEAMAEEEAMEDEESDANNAIALLSGDDQAVIDAVAAQMNADGDIPPGVDSQCMARALVEGMGGAQEMADRYGLTEQAIIDGLEPDNVELSVDQARAMATDTLACGLGDFMVEAMVGDGLNETDAACLFEQLDQDAVRDLIAVEFMSPADADQIGTEAESALFGSIFTAFGACELDPSALGG